MPTEYIDVPAEIFLEYGGVIIYHTYKNDDIRDIICQHSFVLNEFDLEMNSFDVRDISGWTNRSRYSNISEDEHIKIFLIGCIESKLNFNEIY